jgi:hypothetical protein
MTSKYRIEIEVLLDQGAATKAMELAKEVYRERGGARTAESGIERDMSADEFIDSTEQALLELVEGNLLRLPGLAISHENCRRLGPEVETDH